jgi:hypothetical protein
MTSHPALATSCMRRYGRIIDTTMTIAVVANVADTASIVGVTRMIVAGIKTVNFVGIGLTSMITTTELTAEQKIEVDRLVQMALDNKDVLALAHELGHVTEAALLAHLEAHASAIVMLGHETC